MPPRKKTSRISKTATPSSLPFRYGCAPSPATPSSLPFRYGCAHSPVSIPSPSTSPPLPQSVHSVYSSTNSVSVDEDSISPVADVEVANAEVADADAAPIVENKRKWTSEIWLQYDCYNGELFEDGVHRAICKHCKGGPIIADPDNGTTNFIRHYNTCEALHGTNQISKDGILLQRFDQNVYKEMISLAIIRHGYPFTFAEHEGNRNIHSFLHKGFKPISRNTAKNHVMKIHKREKGRLRGLMHKVSGKICLTSDMWTSVVEQGYISLTAHFIDDEWNLHAKILDFCHVEPPHTTKKLHDRLLGLLNNWGIGKKVFSITLDNARCNDNMQEMLTHSLSIQSPFPCGGDYFHVRCSAHILNLIVQEGLKVIFDAVIKVRKLVVWVVGSERRKLNFKETSLYVGVDCSKSLCLDCPTRWNSTYKMLSRALTYRTTFERNSDTTDPSYPPLPDDEDWCRIEKICALLSPFDTLTTLMSGKLYPTANLYFKNVWNIELLLVKYASCEDEFLRKMARSMRVKFDKYWASYSMIFSFVVILDPRYKFNLVQYCFKELNAETSTSKAGHVKSQFCKLFNEYAKVFSPRRRATMSELPDMSTDPLRGFSSFGEFSEGKTELDAYLEAGRSDHTKDLDVLNWWKENGIRYPIVAQMAKDILAIPITTVASESAFSMGSRVLTKWRSSLDPDTADALLSTRSWLFGFDIQGDAENQELHGLEFQISANQDNNLDEEMED